MEDERLLQLPADADLRDVAEDWYRSAKSRQVQIPPGDRQRFEAKHLRTEVEALKKDLRGDISEIRCPEAWDLAGLFAEFAVKLCLAGARANPPASFRHPDRHVAFLKVWLPMWVEEEALKEWVATAPPGVRELLSNPKSLRKFRIGLDEAVGKALNRERQSNPFWDAALDKQIRAKVLRLQAASLEWTENPAGTGFDEHIPVTLMAALDAHAEAYLSKVVGDDLIPLYTHYLRGVGSALIRNAVDRSVLQDPFSDEWLRRMAEPSGPFLGRKHSLTPEQQEGELSQTVETLRPELAKDAARWRAWRTEILIRIETQFEARYRHWEAGAIQTLYPAPSETPGSTPATQAPADDDATAGVAPRPPERPMKPANWEDIELRFVGDHDVEIEIAGKVQKVNYKELPGFEDRRTGKPSLLWTTLRVFATLPDSTMPNARTSAEWTANQKRIERTSKALREYFKLTGDPFPYETATGYRSRITFKPAPDKSH
jgi:hypothetical protein